MSLQTSIATILMGLAEYYEKQLTDVQLAMYVEDLMGIDPPSLLAAVRSYRNDPKNDRFPLPSKLKAMLQPPDDQMGRDAAGLILSAISRIGPYRTGDAKRYLGELAWEVVTMQGGWEEVCGSVTNDNKGILQAQWRELAVALLTKHRLGLHGEAPTLEFKRKGLPTKSLESFGTNLLKGMP